MKVIHERHKPHEYVMAITSTTITAKPRKLKARWTTDFESDSDQCSYSRVVSDLHEKLVGDLLLSIEKDMAQQFQSII
jgi:hypothetical protein